MMDALQAMLDGGWLYLAIGAVVCLLIGIGAVRRMFSEAAKAEAPEPPRHDRRH